MVTFTDDQEVRDVGKSTCHVAQQWDQRAITGFLILYLRSQNISPKHKLSFYAFAVLVGPSRSVGSPIGSVHGHH